MVAGVQRQAVARLFTRRGSPFVTEYMASNAGAVKISSLTPASFNLVSQYGFYLAP